MTPNGSRRDLSRLAGFVVVVLAAGVFFLVRGLTTDRPLLVVSGGVAVGAMALLTFGIVRTRLRQRAMTPEQRDAEHARRLEEARARRPAWMNSPWWALLMFAIAAYWGWYAVAALREGVLWLAAVDGLLAFVGLWAGVQVLRRRRRASSRG